MRHNKLDPQFTSLDLARKIYLNSYECMWNDAMKAAGERNCFYFNDPEMVKKVTESNQKIIIQMKPTKLENYVDWMHTLEKHVVDFHDRGFYDGFVPYRERLTVENGIYLTIRCGLGGIYTTINEMKDNHWLAECLDGSTTIAYRPLKDEEKFNDTTDYEILRHDG